MEDLKQKLGLLLSSQVSDRSSQDYKKLVSFIDAAISKSLNLPPEEQTGFLVTNILNIRDFIQSEIITKSITLDARSKVLQVCDNYFIPKEEPPVPEIKKKEEELEDERLPQENLSEIDPLI